jgi:hypothetical protein
MPCVVALIALIFPRLAILLVVIFSDFIGNAYKTVLWPLLGFFFVPLTTLAYAFAINRNGSVSGGYLVLVVLAVLIDLGLLGASRRRRRKGHKLVGRHPVLASGASIFHPPSVHKRIDLQSGNSCMRWVLAVGLAIALGCDRPDSTARVARPSTAPMAPVLPVIIVDAEHFYREHGQYKPYLLEASAGVVLDASRFAFNDPEKLLRLPNSVHVIYDNSVYVASWPQGGKQMLTLDPASLRVRKGGPFAGFAAGRPAYVAIGFEYPAEPGTEPRFTPFWIGSLVFR